MAARRSAEAAAVTTRFVDEIRMLRLQIAAAIGSGRVVSLLGLSPGVGTTSLAVWLARAFAQEPRQTLLVDANFANPALHEEFDVALEPGAGDVLQGRATLTDVSRPTAGANLFVVTCGRPEAGASVEQWRRQWRQLTPEHFLVVDAGSAASASALTVADSSDGVVLVVKYGDSRREQVEALKKRLAITGTKIFGVILSQRRHVVPAFIYRRL